VQSLHSGVVPKRDIHAKRGEDIKGTVRDLDSIKEGAVAIFNIVANYRSKKAFFIALLQFIVLNKDFIRMHGNRFFKKKNHKSSNQLHSLFNELTHNVSTRTKTSGLIELTQGDVKVQDNNQLAKDELTKSLTEFRNYADDYDLAGVKDIVARLESLPAQHKEEVAFFILNTMISESWFDSKREKRILEKISSTLKVPSNGIYKFLKKFLHMTQKVIQKEKMQKQEISEKPEAATVPDRETMPIVTLDLDSSSEDKTEESVQLLLERIFDGANPQEETLEKETNRVGLSKSLDHIVSRLMECQSLSRQEFCAMVGQYQLMEQGVVEEINEWGHEHLDLDDDFLCFDNTRKMYQVHPESIRAFQEKEDLRHYILDMAN